MNESIMNESIMNESVEKKKETNTRNTVFGYIRLKVNVELQNKIIPKEIMMICYDYYGHDFISSSILTPKQRDKLFELLIKEKENLIPGTTNLIYNGLKDGFNSCSFYSKCQEISPSILIIKSNWGKIFGAFTCIPWKFDSGYHAENNLNDTFLYSLNDDNDKIGDTFKIKKRDMEYAVFHGGSNGRRDDDNDLIFYFGAAAGLLLYENCNLRDDNFSYNASKCGYLIPKQQILCGGSQRNNHYNDKYEFRVQNFELFTVDLQQEKS